MQRILSGVIGCCAILIAGLFAWIAWNLPGNESVEQSFQEVVAVTESTDQQIVLVREHLQQVESSKLMGTFDRLAKHSEHLPKLIKAQRVNFEAVQQARDGLKQLANGLETVSTTVQPETIETMSQGFADVASFIDTISPVMTKTAEQLDQSTARLQENVKLVEKVTEQAPLNLEIAQEIYDSLEKFDQGLGSMDQMLNLDQIAKMKKGSTGLKKAMTTTAEEIETAANYTYPIVTFDGFKPNVQQKKFWPQGEDIASGLKDAAAGIDGLNQEMTQLQTDIPKIQAALKASREVVTKTRTSLGTTLEQIEELKPLFEQAPKTTVQIATQLPKMTAELSGILRQTEKFSEVSESLKKAYAGLKATSTRWTEVQAHIQQTTGLINSFESQLGNILEHQEKYEELHQEASLIADEIVVNLPEVQKQLHQNLQAQSAQLETLHTQVEQAKSNIPKYQQTSLTLLAAGRWLCWLLAAMFGFHGLQSFVRMRSATATP